MKRSFASILAVTTLGFGIAARAATWQGGDMTWSQPDNDSFDVAYTSGDPAVFTSTGWGTVAIAAGGITPGTITIRDMHPLDRATVYYTFAVGEDNALGTASISGDNYSRLYFSNTKGSEVQLANTFAQRFNPMFAFTGGDFRLNGTVTMPMRSARATSSSPAALCNTPPPAPARTGDRA